MDIEALKALRDEMRATGVYNLDVGVWADRLDAILAASQPAQEAQSPLLDQLTRIACETYKLWDSDQDMKVGKSLGALGGTTKYRADIDTLRAALGTIERDLADARAKLAAVECLVGTLSEASWVSPNVPPSELLRSIVADLRAALAATPDREWEER